MTRSPVAGDAAARRRSARGRRSAPPAERRLGAWPRPPRGRATRASCSRRSGRRTTATRALLSFGQDPRWRRFLVSRIAAGLRRASLDVATGTAAVALELARPCRAAGRRRRPERRDARRGPRARRTRRARRADRARRGARRGLPFADGEFDALTFTYLLRYVDDPAATLRELARVVRPGGDDRDARVRPAARALAAALGAVRPRRPARPPARSSRRGWREVGRFLGPEHPRLLRAVSARARCSTPGATPASRDVRRGGSRSAAASSLGTQRVSSDARPAFYALRAGRLARLRDAAPPAVHAWHLSYVAIGAALAPQLRLGPARAGRWSRSCSRWASPRTRSTS